MNYKTAQFTPVTITAETLQILYKQPNAMRLITLYMAYVEISTWQSNNSVKATTSFMAKRLGWTTKSVQSAKKRLKELGLIEDVRRTDDNHKVIGYFVLVKFVIKNDEKPVGGLSEGVDYCR